MGKRSIVPYGPQHPVLPEPIHLDLVLEDEKVLAAIPSICHEVMGPNAMILVFLFFVFSVEFQASFFTLLFHPHQEEL